MKDLILFSIDNNNFALELEKIKRIVQATATTPVAGNADEIEGIFTFEDNVLNVLDFRTMIGVEQFDSRYDEMFPQLKAGHEAWVDALIDTIDNDVPFTKALSPYDCPLGQWLTKFQSYDDTISHVLDDLFVIHAHFHGQASGIIEEAKTCKSCAHDMIETTVQPLKEQVMGFLTHLQEEKQRIANSSQKFLIIDAEKQFAVRIDEIDDIIAINEKDIQSSESFEDEGTLVKINGIFEHSEKLVNLIDSISMPVARRV
jgi:chemotaxis signal transduction protein